MDDQSHRAEQLNLLQRLDDSELVVLNERWAGRTSSEIAGALGISQTAARHHLGNIYDKLEVTYVQGGTSLARVMDFYNVMTDPTAPRIPHPDSLYQDELTSPSPPSGQALELVQDDDDALIAQRPVRAVAQDEPPPRAIWPFVALGVAGVLVLALLLVLLLGDDDGDDDEEAARAETATAFTLGLDATATALAQTATLERQDLDATVTALSVVATQTQDAADVAATEAANATASAQPTITPTPTEEPTATPEPTETPTEEPTEEPTETPEPDETPEPETTPTGEPAQPTPVAGEMIYEADWDENPDEWQLHDNENWAIEDGVLVSSNADMRVLFAPTAEVEFENADYAIEAVIALTELEGCDGVAGLLGRAAVQAATDDQEEFVSGYGGEVCRDTWRIQAVPTDDPEPEELAMGAFDGVGDTDETELDDEPHTYRLEFAGQTIRFFLDGEFLGEATDDRHTEAGQLGLYLNGEINVGVNEFRIFELASE